MLKALVLKLTVRSLCKSMKILYYEAVAEDPNADARENLVNALRKKSDWKQTGKTTFEYTNGGSVRVLYGDSLRTIVEKMLGVQLSSWHASGPLDKNQLEKDAKQGLAALNKYLQ
ncbi:hypothetical protein LF1_11280 [Rubripirellula obstinata]|uniref:Uncharacterized protein n=1 Tax=Rubripirellula obstinata TaxID=406547 RepID=A0A5B1CDE4_9BACT|nr:hypothetical protein [Rubripirellula obstinata]KAA1258606.1 hypothetical protein LF1_11280 [Rubripirellula obstinata]